MSVQLSGQPDVPPQLAAALSYYDKGWSVVPAHKVIKTANGIACSCMQGSACTSKGKHPAISWTKYQTERASRGQIIEWFTGKYRTYNVGLITGQISGFFTVDIDEAPGKPGADTIQDVQMVHGDLPFTVEARTGGGGRHILLKHPGTRYITTAKNVLGPGVDVRGDGGFIVAAPSLHESGRYYLWNEHAHPNTTPIADAPDWLLDFVWTDAAPASGTQEPSTGHSEIIRNEWGRIIDGRESYMIRVICGVIASYCKEHHALPTAEYVFEDAWRTYEEHVAPRGASLEADGRGPTLMRHRIGHMLRRAASGKWKVVEQTATNQDYDPETGEVKQPPDFIATPLDWDEMEAVGPREWVYGHFLIRRFISVLGAPGGTGKTAYAYTVGLSVVTNTELLGEKVHESGNLWIYNLEDPKDELLRRFRAACLHHHITRSQIEGRVFLDSGRDRPLVIAVRTDKGAVIATPVVQPLIDEIKRRQIKLFIPDPFVRTHQLEENVNDQMDFAAAQWAYVADKADCSIMLVHHFRKGGNGGDAAAFRGASAVIDASRAAISLSVMSEDEATKRFNVPIEERWRYIRADNAKLNLAPPPEDATWFKLIGEDLGNATETRASDKVQSVERWEPPTAYDGMPWSMIVRMLDIIDAGLGNGEYYAFAIQSKDRWVGHVIIAEASRTDAQAKQIIKDWKKSGVLVESEYSSPRSKGSMTGCVRVDQTKVAEMRRNLKPGINPDE